MSTTHCQWCVSIPHYLAALDRYLSNVEAALNAAEQPTGGSVAVSPAGYAHWLPSSSTANTPTSTTPSTMPSPLSNGNASRGGLGARRDLRRQDLDDLLLPFLRKSAHLPVRTLDAALAQTLRLYPLCPRPKMTSLIREWFRKKREYMSHRVHIYCRKHGITRAHVDHLASHPDLLDDVRDQCGIEITDDRAARKFVLERMAGFFEKNPRPASTHSAVSSSTSTSSSTSAPSSTSTPSFTGTSSSSSTASTATKSTSSREEVQERERK